jgi:hypothetical protein
MLRQVRLHFGIAWMTRRMDSGTTLDFCKQDVAAINALMSISLEYKSRHTIDSVSSESASMSVKKQSGSWDLFGRRQIDAQG